MPYAGINRLIGNTMPKGEGYPEGKDKSVAEKGAKTLREGQSNSDAKAGFTKSVAKKGGDDKKK